MTDNSRQYHSAL